MKKVTAYHCDFCKQPRLFLSRSGAKRHEARCWLNPARKSCGTCLRLYFDAYRKWECLEKVCVPFSRKIAQCSKYEKNPDGIFDDKTI